MSSRSDVEEVNPAGLSTSHHQLLAAGFNAQGQLSDHRNDDINAFYPVFTLPEGVPRSARVLFAGWSSTVFISGNRLVGLGHQTFDITFEAGLTETLIDGFGDHNGMLGCVSTAGHLYLLSYPESETEPGLECLGTDSSPSIGHIALAGNNHVSISFRQAPRGNLCHILQFQNLSDFLAWFQDPSGTKLDAENQHFMMQGRPTQLLANTATFMLLMESGEVYTWGDPRHQSLGRSISGDNAVLADRPGIVNALEGLRIQKVACGGWMCAALSEDKALYIWGTGTPGTDKTIKILREAGAGEVVLVDLLHEREPLDVLDIGVGDDHIVAVGEDSSERQLWVVGDNENGQLGLDSPEPWLDDWAEVESARGSTHEVTCGPKSTFITTMSSPP